MIATNICCAECRPDVADLLLGGRRGCCPCKVLSGWLAQLCACYLLRHGQLRRYAEALLVQAALNSIWMAAILAYRAFLLSKSHRVMASCSHAYDACWQRLTADPATCVHFEELQALCKTFSRAECVRHLQPPPPRFSELLGKVWQGGPSKSFEMLDSLSNVDFVPVRCLDQLYSQATILQPLMAGKVEELAARHEGLFPWNPRTATRRTSSGDCTEVAFAPWNDWQHDPDVRQMFRRPEMKSISRALEKIERCYDQARRPHILR